MTSGATALDLPFGGLTTTPNQTPSIKGEKWICVARIDYSF